MRWCKLTILTPPYAQTVILAKVLLEKYFPEKNAELKLEEYEPGQKNIPFRTVAEFKGSDLAGIRYEQLLPYAQPTDGDAFMTLLGGFCYYRRWYRNCSHRTQFRCRRLPCGQPDGMGSLTLVDKQGRFTAEMGEFAGRYVKSRIR